MILIQVNQFNWEIVLNVVTEQTALKEEGKRDTVNTGLSLTTSALCRPLSSIVPSVLHILSFIHKRSYIILAVDLHTELLTPWSRVLLNTFAASYLNTQGLNNSCLKSPASTLVDLTFQSRALRSFSLNQLRNMSL